MITLYSYFRSSAAYRVRIALNIKGLEHKIVSVDLLTGEESGDVYKNINPQGLVPTLVDEETTIGQSMAICEYLDDKYDGNLTVFGDAEHKAYVRQMAQIVACEIHPLNNLKVWKGYLGKKLDLSEEQSMEWYRHWIIEGFTAYEKMLNDKGFMGGFTCGDSPSLADFCLIPQLYNARRFNVPLENFPNILTVEKDCMGMKAFQDAAPESQPDAPKDLQPVIHGPNAPLLGAT